MEIGLEEPEVQQGRPLSSAEFSWCILMNSSGQSSLVTWEEKIKKLIIMNKPTVEATS